jgi:hypothetical protein
MTQTEDANHHRGGPALTTYRLEDGPTHVLDEGREPLPGHYQAEFRASDGSLVLRFLTDKGRAWLLQRVDGGGGDLTSEDLHRSTVEPDLGALVAQMEHESGDGA